MKKIHFLGTGSSTGVPILTCKCKVCTSIDSKDKRMRPCLFIEGDKECVVNDMSADFHWQALKSEIERVDAVFLTHSHHDHIAGIDEIRIYNYKQKGKIPFYGNKATLSEVKERFSYIFKKTQEGGGKPKINLHVLEPYDKISLNEFEIQAVKIHHGELLINGYIINGKVAYLTDCSFIPETTYNLIHGIDTIILGAIRLKPHTTHFNFKTAKKEIKRIKPGRAFITHMTHDLTHKELEDYFGDTAIIPYDGLSFEI